MSDWKKMKFIVSFLFIALSLIESTGTVLHDYLIIDQALMYFAAGRCQLQATVRTEEDPTNPGEIVHQTQLQLLCSSYSNMSCTMTNFTCDNYTYLGISRGTEL